MANEVEIQEINALRDKAKANRLAFTHADDIFKNIKTLYFSDKEIHKNISLISSKYLASGFALKYLEVINEILEKKYNIPQLTLDDFIDNDKILQIANKLDEEFIIEWLRNECSEKLKNNIDNIDADDIYKLIKLGHIIDLSLKELSYRERIKGIELYDIIYRYLHTIDSLGLTKYKRNDILKKVELDIHIRTIDTLTTRDMHINISMERQ